MHASFNTRRLASPDMGRPPLPAGSFGRIDFYHDASGRVRARASFRDFDGIRRPVTRWGANATEAESRLRTALADAQAVRLDLPDFVEFMLGTGMRIGEAAAVRDQVLDLTARTVRVEATVVRVPGIGLRLQPQTKTPASRRTLALPAHLIAMLRHRATVGRDQGPYGVVFPSPMRMARDPSNTQADLRAVLDDLGYGWVSSHTFRKTVATRLDEAGMSARQIADHLGHARQIADHLGHARPSMTLDVYLDRRHKIDVAAADALDRGWTGQKRLLVLSCSFLVL